MSTRLSGVGFAVNSILGLAEFPLKQLSESFILLLTLLHTLLDGKFWEILNLRNLFNLVIMARVIWSMSDTRRARVSLDLSLPPHELRTFFQDSDHYMKYATAAYGPMQIAANAVGKDSLLAAPEEETRIQASQAAIR